MPSMRKQVEAEIRKLGLRVNPDNAELHALRIERDRLEDYLDTLEVSRVRDPKLDKIRGEILDLDRRIREVQERLRPVPEGTQLSLFPRSSAMKAKSNPFHPETYNFDMAMTNAGRRTHRGQQKAGRPAPYEAPMGPKVGELARVHDTDLRAMTSAQLRQFEMAETKAELSRRERADSGRKKNEPAWLQAWRKKKGLPNPSNRRVRAVRKLDSKHWLVAYDAQNGDGEQMYKVRATSPEGALDQFDLDAIADRLTLL